MNRWLYFVAASTFLGGAVGGGVWFAIYSTFYTPSIKFDGPAEMALGFSLFLGCLVFGLISLAIFAINNKRQDIINAFSIIIIAGFFTCGFLGYFISNYEIEHTSYCTSFDERPRCKSYVDWYNLNK